MILVLALRKFEGAQKAIFLDTYRKKITYNANLLSRDCSFNFLHWFASFAPNILVIIGDFRRN